MALARICNGEDVVVVTQASIGGFDRSTTAEELSNYLENTIGIVWRCRLKTSWTPPDSYPKFFVADSQTQSTVEFQNVEPHAFVHFASPKAAEQAAKSSLFFKNRTLKVTLGPDNPYRINQKRRNTTPFRIRNVRVEAGFLMSEEEFMAAWKWPPAGIDFSVDPFNGVCHFLFTKKTTFAFKGTREHTSIKCNFRMEFLVRDINWVISHKSPSFFVIFLQLSSYPLVSYRTADDDFYDSVPYDLFDDDDPWIRTTDFTPTGAIGRCNFYRILVSPRYGGTLKKITEYFRERRIVFTESGAQIRTTEEPEFGIPLLERFYCIQSVNGLQFETVFLLNALIHRGILNQHQLSDGRFYDALRRETEVVNVAALKSMCTYRRPVFDPCGRLKLVQKWLSRNTKLLIGSRQTEDLVEVSRLIITPTKAYCLPPEIELSNRVLRQYREVSDRFLRVTFTDEGMQTLNSSVLTYYLAPILREISSDSSGQRTNVFTRIRDILREGVTICGRKYLFLAFSSNQLRDRSAWFFSDGKNVTVTKIRTWMGKFTNRNVAKCAARMGLCFSSTYATVRVPMTEVVFNHPDIERNGYVFSDGIGVMTADLADEVARKLRLEEDPPCAYQIRYAGCKGVVARWPKKGGGGGGGARMFLRPSMNKFKSDHPVVEVCSWTRFQPGFLNRQIVTLLSALEVGDEVFWEMQKEMVFKLERLLSSPEVAVEVLLGSCADFGNTAAIMLCGGFSAEREPHLRGMLGSIRAGQLWGLREKSRIFVSAGRWMMGVLDESGVLEQGQCFVQVSTPSLEGCFSKHGGGFLEDVRGRREVIEGLVVIAKNPCLHPGDVRILQAVDAPGLSHLYDCLVFPQKGDRPHPNEASGSDLDGDLYFVTWDERLIPPSKRGYKPMDYDPEKPKELLRDVTQQDMIEFFTKNMVNESLGAICNAHVVHADSREKGALDPDCIKLAELAAKAVDFPKTGVTVTMPRHLKPKLYPDFMGKEEFQTYRSTKILGRMYRQIQQVYREEGEAEAEEEEAAEDIPYDMGMEVAGSGEFLADAWEKKCVYDRQLSGLLGQYKVKREEEMVTGHIWSMPSYNSRKQGELKERAKHSYASLRKEFRRIFEEVGPPEEMDGEERDHRREQKASAWYQVSYHPRWVQRSVEMNASYRDHRLVMLSFPWIATDYLVRVRIRFYGVPPAAGDPSGPLCALARFIYDRV